MTMVASVIPCELKIWRKIARKKLTKAQFTSLVTKGQTGKIKGLVGKSGKKFEAKLKLKADFGIGFVFD